MKPQIRGASGERRRRLALRPAVGWRRTGDGQRAMPGSADGCTPAARGGLKRSLHYVLISPIHSLFSRTASLYIIYQHIHFVQIFCGAHSHTFSLGRTKKKKKKIAVSSAVFMSGSKKKKRLHYLMFVAEISKPRVDEHRRQSEC